MTEQIRKTMERDGMDGNSHRAHRNGREQAGMSRESRGTMEKVRENTVHDSIIPYFFLGWIDAYMPHRNIRLFSLSLQFYFILF